jgi:hypothetical protein
MQQVGLNTVPGLPAGGRCRTVGISKPAARTHQTHRDVVNRKRM